VADPEGFSPHVHREVFDHELLAVKEGVVRMGASVTDAIDAAVACLQGHDVAAARDLVEADGRINQAQVELNELVVTTIATQSPVARDLRMLIALSHASYELERIGDHAAGVARHAIRLADADTIGTASLVKMGHLVSGLLSRVLRALADLDQRAAREIAAGDDEVDRLYHAYFARVLQQMRADPASVDSGTQLLFAAKDLERIGDRVTNSAEEVVFLATGEVEDLNP
jgi:phosphate transport system protein